MLTRPGFLLPPVPSLGRSTHRAWLVVSGDRRPVPDARLVDRTGRRVPPRRRRQPQHHRRGPHPSPTPAAGPATGESAVRLRRRFRPGPTHRRIIRSRRPGRGAYPRRPQVLHPAAGPPTRAGWTSPPPRQTVLLRQAFHLAGTRRGAPLQRRP